jgi:hypothetical protein
MFSWRCSVKAHDQIGDEEVRPGHEDPLRKWMAQLNRRSAEVRETFAQEGARHEQADFLKSADGLVLIYAMQAADHARASSVFRNSTLAIDEEPHHGSGPGRTSERRALS